ncbi:MAG: Lrp/AsnC family transcriptional regulator [Bacteroidales bacterium]
MAIKNIDEIDRKLLNIMQDNSRITIRELSERLHLSTTPIHERIKKLEKNGFIKHYVTLLEPKMLGKKLTVFVSVSLTNHTKEIVDEFEKEMKKMPEVMECYYVSGNWDFLLKIQCNDMEDYHNFVIHRFSVIKNITQFNSSFVMSESKITHKFEL